VDAVPPFEFTAAYDEASLQAATRILFRRNWKWQLPLTTGVVVGVLGTGVFLWNLRLHGLAWFCFAYPLLFPPLWMLSYWTIRRRLLMRLGKSVEVRMTAADFTIAWDGESHTFPWTRFKSALTELFVEVQFWDCTWMPLGRYLLRWGLLDFSDISRAARC
jgi:hypothetical protein